MTQQTHCEGKLHHAMPQFHLKIGEKRPFKGTPIQRCPISSNC